VSTVQNLLFIAKGISEKLQADKRKLGK